jgi:phage terminase small subunit
MKRKDKVKKRSEGNIKHMKGKRKKAKKDVPVGSLPSLTINEKYFVKEYVKHFSAARAYRAVSPHITNQVSASAMGVMLLKKPEVREEVDRRLRNRAKKLHLEGNQVLLSIMWDAFADKRHFFNEDNTFKSFHELNVSQASCINSVEVLEQYEWVMNEDGVRERQLKGYLKKIKWNDQLKAKELLLKHLGLLVERHQHSGNQTIEHQLKVEQVKRIDTDDLRKLRKILQRSAEEHGVLPALPRIDQNRIS